jgi:exonuclease SbcD
MRLLHTSDWHLGQSFHQFDRRAEHQAFLDWLLGVLEAEAVDALLIAGDVFDNSNPSAQAQAQLYRFLAEARRRVPQLAIVMTAGNHDSPGRLEAPAPLLSVFDASVIGHVGRQGDLDAALGRLLVPLKDAAGREAAWCIAMPFLRPDDLPRVEGTDDPYAAGVAALYRRAFELAAERRQPGQAIVAIGHCHLAGGEVSEDSERRIVIGGAEALPAGIFDPRIAYVALGHLHRAQKIGGDPTRRYCGSPLPMSFSEVGYRHQVVLVDLAARASPKPARWWCRAASTCSRCRPNPRRWTTPWLRSPRSTCPTAPRLSGPTCTCGCSSKGPSRPARPHRGGPRRQAGAPRPHRNHHPARRAARRGAGPVAGRAQRPQARGLLLRLYQQRFGSDAPPELMAAFGELLDAPAAEGAA